MKMQTAMSANIAESIFRSVVSGITKTATDGELQLGEPVILATATIGVAPLGQEVIRPLTHTTVGGVNRLSVGPIASTSIDHESCGLVQVYGIATVRLAEAATVAAGDKMVPGLNSTATALASYGHAAWIHNLTVTNIAHLDNGCYVIAVAAATAVSGTNSYTNGYAFVRAL